MEEAVPLASLAQTPSPPPDWIDEFPSARFGQIQPVHEIVEEDIASSFKGALTIGKASGRGTALTLVRL
jgi:hypothetical protein